VFKYAPSGSVEWARYLEYGGAGEIPYHLHGVSVDASENVYSCGSYYGYVWKLNSAGVVQWEKRVRDTNVKDIASTPDGRICIVGGDATGTVIVCCNTSGTRLWARQQNGGTWEAVTFDAKGDAYVCGSRGYEVILAKYSSTGDLLWQRSIVEATGADIGCFDLAVVENDLYVTGHVSNTPANILVAKIPTDGSKTGQYGILNYRVSQYVSSVWAGVEDAPNLYDFTGSQSNVVSTLTMLPFGLTNSLRNL
jgi:hypothetical protein